MDKTDNKTIIITRISTEGLVKQKKSTELAKCSWSGGLFQRLGTKD